MKLGWLWCRGGCRGRIGDRSVELVEYEDGISKYSTVV